MKVVVQENKDLERGEIVLDLISVSDASRMLGIGKGVIYFLIRHHDLERFRIGNRVFITRQTLESLKRWKESRFKLRLKGGEHGSKEVRSSRYR